MTLVMTLLVRDEEDILDATIRFHLERGVDFVILTDNRSRDGTAEIARSYERAGVLRYLYQDDDDYAQARWVTRMARIAGESYGADWVLNADADEFWYPGAGTIADAFAAAGDARCVVAERTNFVARPADGRPFWERMTVRHRRSTNALGAALPPKVAHRGCASVSVAQGNHAVSFGDDAVAPARPVPVEILHFPVRSRAQYERKIRAGGAAYERNAELDPGIGATWRHLYRRLLDGEDIYRDEEFSDDAVAAGVRSGDLLPDTRLFDALTICR